MSRKNENKSAYQKPSIELITMDSEGSLLLTASVPVSGGMGSTNAFGSGGTISNRTKTKPATSGMTSTKAFGAGGVISNRSK